MTAIMWVWVSGAAVALLLLVTGWRWGAMRAASWAALAAIGQTAMVALVKARLVHTLIWCPYFRATSR